MIRKLRKAAGRKRVALVERLRSGSIFERNLYYGFVSDAFKRERHLVSSGHREYRAKERLGTQEYLVRRNIHMLEKGLTMVPRRSSFAVDYIEQTVLLLSAMHLADTAVLSPSVEQWARNVLEQYFDATSASTEPAIASARGKYEQIGWEDDSDGVSGPHHPDVSAPPVTIDSLMSLAVRRKSVRWFLDSPVPRDAIDTAMLVAREAPSACNRQPFSFRVFDDPEIVAAVSAIPMGTAGYAKNLPAIAVIVGDLSAFIDERDRHLIYTDGCLAAMSFILGLEAQGIASVCINWPDVVERDRRMAKLLNLSSHERVVMLVGFGFADPELLTPFSAKRRLTDLRTYNRL